MQAWTWNRTWARRAAALLAAPVLLLGAGCESFMAAEAARQHPVQGRLVDVGGRRIQIDCRGDGGPTVVFQAGGDMMGSLGWTPALERVSKNARACAYSRAGILWSDPAHSRFEPEEVARDLHNALEAAGETPPYVLVGHSRGGLYNMIYAGMYKDEVAGLVFADSSHPDQEARFEEAGLPTGEYVSLTQEMGLAFKWTGVMRLSPYPTDPSIESSVKAFFPKSAEANAREARARARTLEAAGRYRDLINWPVVVLARELPEQTAARKDADMRDAELLSPDGLDPSIRAPVNEVVWRKLQADIAGWSSKGRLQVVPESNHAFFFFKPEVIEGAVNEVLAAVRVQRRPSPLVR